MEACQFEAPCGFRTRYELLAFAAKQTGDRRVLYLESGVALGNSCAFWARLLRNPEAHPHGLRQLRRASVDVDPDETERLLLDAASTPHIPDPRVRFFKSWFEDTLPTYTFPDHDRLSVNMDADLYSSTVFVLNSGVFLYFDEFNHRADELRAVDECLEETQLEL
jgi:hypothetical protein